MTGQNFVVGDTTIDIDGIVVKADVQETRSLGSSLRFVVPEGLQAGPVEVVAKTEAGSSNLGAFTVIADIIDANRPPSDPYYSNCDAARAAGAAPLYRGQPGYRPGLDRDDDGVACETGGVSGNGGNQGSNGSGLARTGSELFPLALVGVALVGMGVAFLRRSRQSV